jgi:hypothetical protein
MAASGLRLDSGGGRCMGAPDGVSPMAHAIVAILATALFTLIELWILKKFKFDVFGRLNRAQEATDSTRFFLEALVLVAFILIQPAILIGILGLASPELAYSARQGITALVNYGYAFGI